MTTDVRSYIYVFFIMFQKFSIRSVVKLSSFSTYGLTTYQFNTPLVVQYQTQYGYCNKLFPFFTTLFANNVEQETRSLIFVYIICYLFFNVKRKVNYRFVNTCNNQDIVIQI